MHAAGGQPSGDLEARVAALEARVDALQSAVASAAQALGSLGQGVRGDSAGAGWRRPPAGRGAGGRGDWPADALNAGLAAAAKAARELVGEVQQWSPRRRT